MVMWTLFLRIHGKCDVVLWEILWIIHMDKFTLARSPNKYKCDFKTFTFLISYMINVKIFIFTIKNLVTQYER